MLKYVVGAALVMIALAVGSPAKAGSSSAIVNVQTNKCLDIQNYSTAPGAPSQQYDCLGGTNQLWAAQVIAFQPGGAAFARLVSVGSGLCLDISSGANGAQVIQNTCNGVASQNWIVSAPYSNTTIGSASAGFWVISQVAVGRTLVNAATGLCLDATATGGNGALIQQYTCGSGQNQRWYIDLF